MSYVIPDLIDALNEYGETTRDINSIIFQKGNYRVKIWITDIELGIEYIFLTFKVEQVSYKDGGEWKYLSDLSNLPMKIPFTLAKVEDGKIVVTRDMLEAAKEINIHINAIKLLNSNKE